jgi:hypothetical protein
MARKFEELVEAWGQVLTFNLCASDYLEKLNVKT